MGTLSWLHARWGAFALCHANMRLLRDVDALGGSEHPPAAGGTFTALNENMRRAVVTDCASAELRHHRLPAKRCPFALQAFKWVIVTADVSANRGNVNMRGDFIVEKVT